MTEDIRREEALAADLLPRMQALYQSAKTLLAAMRSSVREILDHPKRRTKDFDAKAPERALKTEQYGIWSDGLLAALDAAEQGEQTLAGYAKALRLLPPKPTKTGYKLLHDDGILAPWLVCWKEASQIQKMLADISISDFGRDRITCMAADKVYELVLKLHERLLARKLSQNQLAFYDLEQYAVRLLADAELTEQHEVVFTQTDAAKAIAADYDCVMVDECQDNNSVQDIIFRMLTDGTDHLFMVGDVKQSIYRFRHAKPELFSNRQQTYAAADAAQSGDPTCIVLKDNFRSRRSVVDAVNYLFTRIMSPVCGEVRYDAAAAMRAARSYPALPPPFSSDTELHLLDNFREDKRVPKIDQAEYIAEVIAEKIRIGFPVTDAATGNLRPCRYSDFMVLMRNRAILPRLVSALEAQHISYRTEGIKGFYKTSEIAACLAMLRAVQNPQEDVSLWGYLLSPFGLFDFDDAAQLRLIANANGCRYIADALRIAAEDEKSELTHKAEYALTLLRRLRRDSMRMTLSDFLRTAFVRSHTRALLGAGEDGGQKTANLDLLQKDAQTWETTHTGGIAGYLNYVEQLLENDEDIASAWRAYSKRRRCFGDDGAWQQGIRGADCASLQLREAVQ